MASVRFTIQTDVRDNLALYTALLGGADEITLSPFADYMRGFAGDDRMWGNAGNDSLFGEQGNDVIGGGAGNDVLYGGAGRDQLTGGAGTDVLVGGADRLRDAFVFFAAAESRAGASRDTVAQFVPGIDEIDLLRIDADADVAGNQSFQFTGRAARAHSVWFADAGADIILRADVTGDRVADFEIRLTGVTAITAGDVIL